MLLFCFERPLWFAFNASAHPHSMGDSAAGIPNNFFSAGGGGVLLPEESDKMMIAQLRRTIAQLRTTLQVVPPIN